MARLRAVLVTATALVSGVVPATVAAAAPVTAGSLPAGSVTAGATEATEAGTVVQEGGPLVVRTGEAAVTTRITVTLPESVTGTVTPRLDLGLPIPSGGDEYVPDTHCSVNGEPFEDCGWGWWNPENVTPLPAAMAQRTITYDIRISALSFYAYAGNRDGELEMRDENGTVVASGPVGFRFVRGTPEAGDRTTLHARDRDGVLWQYESTADPARPLKPRTRVGGGWNGYTSLTKLSFTTASGHGSLVARDKDGVLWYHEGSGNPAAPFKPRVREGGGWNTYTSISAGYHGLIARDRDGVLWNYPYENGDSTGAPLKPRVRVGGGWNAYNLISTIGGRVVARDSAGVLWSYEPRKWAPGVDGAPFKPRVRVGGGWNTYNAVRGTGDLDGWSSTDGVARDAAGNLWLYKDSPTAARTKIGWNWQIYNAIV
ncbi:hypothetical protein ACFXGT_05670 [Streptomyces sp. NPDC059352]|uniref:hypothetical protein n=1 Tax=Streptomyces sp. NPDC059352 TaxID=3346810 RepID=UPI00368DB051